MTTKPDLPPVISVMLAVSDATAAARWYSQALGAAELWNLGGVVGPAIGHLWLVGDRSPLRTHDPQ